MILRSLEQLQPPPTAINLLPHHQALFSQAGTQPSLLPGPQFAPIQWIYGDISTAVTSPALKSLFHIFPRCHYLWLGGFQQLLELSCLAMLGCPLQGNPRRSRGHRPEDTAERGQIGNPALPLGSWPGKGGSPAHGVLRNVWDPSQCCSGLGGFESSSLDITSGNHNKDKRHHRLLCKQRRIRWVITSASKKNGFHFSSQELRNFHLQE